MFMCAFQKTKRSQTIWGFLLFICNLVQLVNAKKLIMLAFSTQVFYFNSYDNPLPRQLYSKGYKNRVKCSIVNIKLSEMRLRSLITKLKFEINYYN